MGLFGKKNKLDADLGKLWEIEPEPVVDYNSVLEYLVGLSGDDYTKICQVAAVYREADYQAAKVLGVEHEATTFIHPPEPPTVADSSFTNDDGEIDFLEDEPVKTTAIKVTNAPKEKGKKK